jgi:ribose transport system substrate-binding protein
MDRARASSQTRKKQLTVKGKQLNPKVKVLTASADYDLGKQFTEIDNFIAAGVDLILLNAADPNAIEPAIKRAQAAGIVVVAIDVAAKGADATVQTNNVQAGEIACQFIVDKLGGKGEVIIENGPQVSAVIDRVNGCKTVFNVTQGYLTRFPKIAATWPQSSLAVPASSSVRLTARRT